MSKEKVQTGALALLMFIMAVGWTLFAIDLGNQRMAEEEASARACDQACEATMSDIARSYNLPHEAIETRRFCLCTIWAPDGFNGACRYVATKYHQLPPGHPKFDGAQTDVQP